jgi:glycosyltransferase involved in cell wall biosynthesis
MSTVPVSVVVPCYRCVQTVGRALASVATQTSRPAEVILVEDGSDDGTIEHLRKLAAAHESSWIRIIALQRNLGAASARNAGWDAATQPYVAFLDSDDAWHPRKLELQYGFMTEHPDIALSAHAREVLFRDEVPADEVGPVTFTPISKTSLLLSNNFLAPTVVMLRRDVPGRFLDGRRHVDDHLLWLQLVCAGFAFVRLSPRLAYMYKASYGQSGLSSQLWEMEKAELQNYWILRASGCIGAVSAVALNLYSFAKFVRRVLLVFLRRLADY